jgi:DNA-binding CsgD family transcriptional regulator
MGRVGVLDHRDTCAVLAVGTQLVNGEFVGDDVALLEALGAVIGADGEQFVDRVVFADEPSWIAPFMLAVPVPEAPASFDEQVVLDREDCIRRYRELTGSSGPVSLLGVIQWFRVVRPECAEEVDLSTWPHADLLTTRVPRAVGRPSSYSLVREGLGHRFSGRDVAVLAALVPFLAAHDRLRPQRARPGADLTPREHEVLDLVATGATNQQVATCLGVSALTVKKHLEHVFGKLGVTTRTAACACTGRVGERVDAATLRPLPDPPRGGPRVRPRSDEPADPRR